MANKFKGEYEFKAGDETFVMSFSADALVECEAALGKSADQIVEMFNDPSKMTLAAMRLLFWKGLADQREGFTLDQTRAVLKRLLPSEMGEHLARAFILAMPDAPSGDARPPMPDQANGTGPASSTDGVS